MAKRRRLPHGVTLRGKFNIVAVGVVCLMLLVGVANIVLVRRTTTEMQSILNDNTAAYNMQQAVANEERTFREYVQARGNEETYAAFRAAVSATAQCLAALPFDYAQIGESRYEATWRIRNSYQNYCEARKFVLDMSPSDTGYIVELYKVYARQDYLIQYCAELTARVLEDGTATYTAESAAYLRMPYGLLGIVLLGMLGLLMLLYSALGDLFRELGVLAEASRRIERNVFTDPDLVWKDSDEMGALVRTFNAMKHAMNENLEMQKRLHHDELARVELEKRFSDAQFQALKNQLNPHFLFNALNTVAQMAEIEDAPTSKQMTVAVSNLLRYNLRTNDPFVPLAQELKVVDDYIYIQQMRFGDRVRYRLDCPVDRRTPVPVFLLQPLVENAVHHGLADTESGGVVTVCVRQNGAHLRISVSDTGGGMPPERLAAVRSAMQVGDNAQGIGLGNLKRRLMGLYEDGDARVYSREGYGTAVIMEFGTPKEEWKEDAAQCTIS